MTRAGRRRAAAPIAAATPIAAAPLVTALAVTIVATFLGAFASILSACAAVAEPTPDDSIYRLDMDLTTQAGAHAALDLHGNHPTLVTMFYGSCAHACPLIISMLQRIERDLSADERGRTRVLMVSLDPDRDSPELLLDLAERHEIDSRRWTLARASSADVRSLAAVLGVRYRRLPDGELNHSTVIALLDPQGRIVARTSTIGGLDEPFMEHLRRVLSDARMH